MRAADAKASCTSGPALTTAPRLDGYLVYPLRRIPGAEQQEVHMQIVEGALYRVCGAALHMRARRLARHPHVEVQVAAALVEPRVAAEHPHLGFRPELLGDDALHRRDLLRP